MPTAPAAGLTDPSTSKFVTPWITYGNALTLSGSPCPDVGDHAERNDHRTSIGVEVLVHGTRAGALVSYERSAVGAPCGSQESGVNTAAAGVLGLLGQTGRARWDHGVSVGFSWPDPWGGDRVNLVLRWRLACAVQVHRLAALELAGGLQGDTADYRGPGGVFGRMGIRFGARK